MKVGLFYLPTIGSVEELQQGMAGRRTDLYQRMVRNLTEQLQYCDEHGYWGYASTEHHFHIEGEEVSTNPILLDLYFAQQTKRLKVGQLGIVLPCANPLRVAEDLAMLDQLTQGRAFAGFARGYQPRWVNALGQHYDTLADSTSDPERYEALKRELYEEHFEIVIKAWTQGTFHHKGKHWEIPTPNTHWAAQDITRRLGRGVDAAGVLTEVGIVPEPFQKPHPPIFQPFSFSESSIRWAAERDIVPISIVCDIDLATAQFRACQETHAASGRDVAFGERMGLTREIIVADTDDEAFALGVNGSSQVWHPFFGPFGFNAALANDGEDYRTIPETFESQVERGLTICGSPDTVSRKLEELLRELPAEYLFCFTFNEVVPQKAMMRHFELLTEKVLPNFSDEIR